MHPGVALQTHVAALKQSLAQSKEALEQYQWTETTVVLLNGEEKSRKQYLSRYGADGTLQKTLVEASPEKKERACEAISLKKRRRN